MTRYRNQDYTNERPGRVFGGVVSGVGVGQKTSWREKDEAREELGEENGRKEGLGFAEGLLLDWNVWLAGALAAENR